MLTSPWAWVRCKGWGTGWLGVRLRDRDREKECIECSEKFVSYMSKPTVYGIHFRG
jgi:hypothetical protein